MAPEQVKHFELSSEEKRVAFGIWESLMQGNKLDCDAWLVATEPVQRAILAQMAARYQCAMDNRTEPDTSNPFI
jgi:hypothetical protein